MGAIAAPSVFTASVEPFSGLYVWAQNPSQSYFMEARDGATLHDMATYAANDWNQGLNVVAQTGHARATGNTVPFTSKATRSSGRTAVR